MSLRKSRRQLWDISIFFGLLDSRACRLSLRLINRAEGPFPFLPLPLRLSSTSRRLSTRALPPPSTFTSAPTLAAASPCPYQKIAAPLRCSTVFGEFFFLSSIDLFRVRTGSSKLHGVLPLFFIKAYRIDSKRDILLCGSNDNPSFAIRSSLLCIKTRSGTS